MELRYAELGERTKLKFMASWQKKLTRDSDEATDVRNQSGAHRSSFLKVIPVIIDCGINFVQMGIMITREYIGQLARSAAPVRNGEQGPSEGGCWATDHY